MIYKESSQMFERAGKFIPGGVNSASRRLTPLIAWERGDGAYLWDMDGNKYTDYHGAWGPIIVGYNNRYIKERVKDSVDRYDLYGTGVTEAEVEFAERICGYFESADKVLACGSGSEATYHAIRVARSFTGAEKIIKFQGCFHGWHDYVLMNTLSKPEMLYRRDPGSAGMLDAAVDSTIVCRLNDLQDVENACEENSGKIAAIIIEPLCHNIGCVLLKQEFIEGLRRICDDRGIVLIFDEVVTGFRVGLGGYEKACGVLPDLITLGKAIANGFPVAALAGREDIMMRFNTCPGGDTAFQGTYNGHPALLSAALATMDLLEEPGFYERLFSLGERLASGFSKIIQSLGVNATVANYGSVMTIYWGAGAYENYDSLAVLDTGKALEFRRAMIAKGHYFVPMDLKRILVTASHAPGDIDATLQDAEKAFKEIIAGKKGGASDYAR